MEICIIYFANDKRSSTIAVSANVPNYGRTADLTEMMISDADRQSETTEASEGKIDGRRTTLLKKDIPRSQNAQAGRREITGIPDR